MTVHMPLWAYETITIREIYNILAHTSEFVVKTINNSYADVKTQKTHIHYVYRQLDKSNHYKIIRKRNSKGINILCLALQTD